VCPRVTSDGAAHTHPPDQRTAGGGARCPGSRAMGASEATTNPPAADRCPAKRSGHAVSRGHDGRGERPATGHRAAPTHVWGRASRRRRTLDADPQHRAPGHTKRTSGDRARAAMTNAGGHASRRRRTLDADPQHRAPGRPRRTSGDGARATPTHVWGRAHGLPGGARPRRLVSGCTARRTASSRRYRSGSSAANPSVTSRPTAPSMLTSTDALRSVCVSVMPLMREITQKPPSFIHIPIFDPQPIATAT
jgi:hypothetical protein